MGIQDDTIRGTRRPEKPDREEVLRGLKEREAKRSMEAAKRASQRARAYASRMNFMGLASFERLG